MSPVNCGSHADYHSLLLLIFVNIILILTPLPTLHEILSSVSGILIYLSQILLWLINILNSVLHQELLPVCRILTFFPLPPESPLKKLILDAA